jgi:spermidine synthase
MPTDSAGDSNTSRAGAETNRYLPTLLVLFVGSGCSALVYEVVWLQLLQLVIGSSALSLGVLLGTFMGGMCLGSLLLPRWITPSRHPLRVYAMLELGIGAFGLLLLHVMPLVNGIYVGNVGHGFTNMLMRGMICVICLLPPTALMGATLPAIARWMETNRQDISRLGFFYGSNIAGAVLGCILAGFYLLRVHDLAVATYVAATINLVIGLIGLRLAAVVPHRLADSAAQSTAVDPDEPKSASSSLASSSSAGRKPLSARLVYIVIALSGFCSLGAEVIWTRQLSLLLGATVYTFSIILAVFLVGLGLGSSVGAVLSRKVQDARIAFGVCQLFVVAAVAWTAYQLSSSLPYWPIDATLPTPVWLGFQLDVVRCMWAFLPASFLWGASFPLALAAAADGDEEQDAGRLVGGLYAANTVGAIVGALAFSMLAVAWLGTQQAQQAIMLVAAISAATMFVTVFLRRVSSAECTVADKTWPLALTIASGAAMLLVQAVPPTPNGLIGYGRNLPTWYKSELPEFIYSAEGMNASIAVSRFENGATNFHVSGKVVASSEPQDMRLQRMLGHIPAMFHPEPKSVLIVGCGAGVTAGSFIVHPSIERIVICEIEPLIPKAATKYFENENYGLLNDPRVEVVHDDARHFIATTSEKFDIITSDPIHPWVKGAAALYSKEYYELCKKRLTPDGIVTQWVPLYETSFDAAQTEVATFFKAFPAGTVWSNDIAGEGYDIILLGHPNNEFVVDADALQTRLERDDHAQVLESLSEVGLGSSLRLLLTFAGSGPDLEEWCEGAEINTDRSLKLQYIAGMGLNQYVAADIYDTMLRHRRYSATTFPAKGILGRALKVALQNAEFDERLP